MKHKVSNFRIRILPKCDSSNEIMQNGITWIIKSYYPVIYPIYHLTLSLPNANHYSIISHRNEIKPKICISLNVSIYTKDLLSKLPRSVSAYDRLKTDLSCCGDDVMGWMPGCQQQKHTHNFIFYAIICSGSSPLYALWIWLPPKVFLRLNGFQSVVELSWGWGWGCTDGFCGFHIILWFCIYGFEGSNGVADHMHMNGDDIEG